MKYIAEKIKQAREALGLNQSELARRLGVTPQAVQKWESGESFPKGARITALAKELNVNAADLVSEETDPEFFARLKQARERQQFLVDRASVGGTPVRGAVPLVSWVKAGGFSEAIDLHQPGHAEEWIQTTTTVRRYTFALRVFNDSMEPDFPAGTILIVEPEMDPQPGDFVIAKNGDNEATFKQLIKDGSDLYLKPLNPRYPLKKLDAECRIIGVVRASERRFR